ncbi:Olfactory receptor 12, partial [Ophiophagus hannah]
MPPPPPPLLPMLPPMLPPPPSSRLLPPLSSTATTTTTTTATATVTLPPTSRSRASTSPRQQDRSRGAKPSPSTLLAAQNPTPPLVSVLSAPETLNAVMKISCSVTFVNELMLLSVKVNHFFCDIPAVMNAAMTNTYINEVVIFSLCNVIIAVTTCVIFTSYAYIFSTILKMHLADGRQKAFSTCASHITAIAIFYGLFSSFMLSQHPYLPLFRVKFGDVSSLFKMSLAELMDFLLALLILLVPFSLTIVSHFYIISTVLYIPSTKGKQK